MCQTRIRIRTRCRDLIRALQTLINNLQAFLLELGKGFAFVARQKRITLDGDHFYIDLVFYHTILKCYVILDIKTGRLTHQDRLWSIKAVG